MTDSTIPEDKGPKKGSAAPRPVGQGLLPAAFRSRLDLAPPESPDSTQETGSAFTFRAFVLGALLAAFIGGGVAYSTLYLQGSFMALGFSTVGAVCMLVVLTGLVNPLLKLSRLKGLRQGELLLVYIMMVMASPIPTVFNARLISQLAAPFYFATPENDWQPLIHPHLPTWMMPHQLGDAQSFFEGMGPAYTVPWGAWLPVLIAWQPFVWALFLVMIATMVILRRQWIDNERLVYPLVQVPLAMTEMGTKGQRIPPFFKNRVMWAGFALAATWSTLHGLYAYFPEGLNFAQQVDIFHQVVPIMRDTSSLYIILRFHILGFFYFLKTEVALSLWVFNLLANIMRGGFSIVGLGNTPSLGGGHGIGHSLQVYHAMGAMLVLFLSGLWAGRRHLATVWRKTWSGDESIDDSQEILSYRGAVAIIVLGTGVMVGWLWLAGLPLWACLALLFLAGALFVAFTRVVAEGGLSDGAPPVVPAGILVSAVGSSALGAPGLVLLATTYIWSSNIRSFVMASCANSLKLSQAWGHRRPLFWAMVLALALALTASTWMILELSYEHGNLNLRTGAGQGGPYHYIQGLLRYPTEVHLWGWINMGLGAAAMLGLTLARWHYTWWPLHPLGYPIGPTWIMDHLWFNMFLAWFIKVLVLKYGGASRYHQTRPFFMGLILGQLVPGGAFLVVDHFYGTVGNVIFWG
ncbi:MAG: hypothetical protein GKR89_29025 [Candidatus Latescibacteria bacterium]|nr:hypothetical protein [Candidatus Latescibacterota bacterium]